MTAVDLPRSRTILRHRLAADVVGLPVVWAGFAVFVAVVVGAVAVLRAGGIETSGWEQASQLTRWYAGAIGVYLTAVHLPLYVAHGFTRHEFLIQLPALTMIFAAAYALLMTAGYWLEALAYGLADWPQALTSTHLFDAPTQYPLVFVESLLLGAVWVVAGALLGAAFYRNGGLGALLIPVALVLVGAVEAAAGPRLIGPIPLGQLTERLPGEILAGASTGQAVGTTAVALIVGFALLWPIARDLPLRGPG